MNDLQRFENTICIILSGGLSTRMHTHKALLRFSENENFLQHIVNVYQRAGINKIIVVKNSDIEITKEGFAGQDVTVVENYSPEKGRLFSIQLGLAAAPGVQYCFIQNIDNPFVTEQLVSVLYDVRDFADYITPEVHNKGGHPVLISARVIKKISLLTAYRNTLSEILGMFNRYKLQTDDANCLLNINYRSDYEKYFCIQSENNSNT